MRFPARSVTQSRAVSRWLLAAALAPVVLGFGCRKESQFDCLKSTGKQSTARRELPTFQHLTLLDGIDVELVADSLDFVEWQAGENLLEGLKNEIQSGGLILRNDNRCNWVRSSKKTVKAVLHTSSLVHILHDGFGTLRTPARFDRDSMVIELTDAGDADLHLKTRWLMTSQHTSGTLTLRGTSDYLFAGNAGTGKLQARDFLTSVIYTNSTGEGDMTVRPWHVLNSRLSNYGNLYFAGSPIWVDTIRTGKGRYIHLLQ